MPNYSVCTYSLALISLMNAIVHFLRGYVSKVQVFTLFHVLLSILVDYIPNEVVHLTGACVVKQKAIAFAAYGYIAVTCAHCLFTMYNDDCLLCSHYICTRCVCMSHIYIYMELHTIFLRHADNVHYWLSPSDRHNGISICTT